MSRLDCLHKIRAEAPAILPSMLLCDFSNLERDVEQLEQANVAALHLDVMDGVFVPNFTYGMTIVNAFRKLTDLPLDVHLMISNPQNYISAFVKAGADVITFHVEAVDDPKPVLKQIREENIAGGLAFNASTPVEAIADSLDLCDIVVVMSIEAGFGGQTFQPAVLSKLKKIRELAGPEIVLEIDGGVNRETIDDCVKNGAELLVAGSAIFNQNDYRQAIEELNQHITV